MKHTNLFASQRTSRQCNQVNNIINTNNVKVLIIQDRIDDVIIIRALHYAGPSQHSGIAMAAASLSMTSRRGEYDATEVYDVTLRPSPAHACTHKHTKPQASLSNTHTDTKRLTSHQITMCGIKKHTKTIHANYYTTLKSNQGQECLYMYL